MKCQNCNTDNRDGAEFCAYCGESMSASANVGGVVCAKCGFTNSANQKFCSNCGSKLEMPQVTKPHCSQCGKEYSTAIRFCSDCGGEVTTTAAPPASHRYDADNGSTHNTRSTTADSDYSNYKGKRKWNGFVTFFVWLGIIGYALSMILGTYYIILSSQSGAYSFEHGLTEEMYASAIVYFLSGLLGLPTMILLLKRIKVAFWVYAGLCVLGVIYNLIAGTGIASIFGLGGILLFYAILQIRKDGVSAWSTLK